MDAVLAEAERNNPDVIVLVEMQRYWWHKMIRRHPLPAYPYGTNLPNRNSGDVGVFSRVPVRRMEEVTVESRTSLIVDLMLGTEKRAFGGAAQSAADAGAHRRLLQILGRD